MSHIENLLMNVIRKALEQLQKEHVGYIDDEATGIITYCVDDGHYKISINKVGGLK